MFRKISASQLSSQLVALWSQAQGHSRKEFFTRLAGKRLGFTLSDSLFPLASEASNLPPEGHTGWIPALCSSVPSVKTEAHWPQVKRERLGSRDTAGLELFSGRFDCCLDLMDLFVA